MARSHEGKASAERADTATVADPAVSATLRFFRRLFRGYHPRDFSLRLWDGTEWPAETAEPVFTWIIRRRGAPARMFRAWDTDVHLGEAYVYGDFDVEGRLEAAFHTADWLLRGGVGAMDALHLAADLRRLPSDDDRDHPDLAAHLRGKVHSRDRDRQAISFHYDRSNDFYALWLDRRMVYSCGYFERADADLDAAQEAKLDLVCRKLRLRPGERLLDIGCGWGSLVMHAAERYGVDATGITLSEEQAELAARRIAEAGLGKRCRVRVQDYRDLHDERFDKLASIGMVEHVGSPMLPEYFAAAWRLLRPGGAFLNHGITWSATEGRLTGETFDTRFVFPDGRLTTLHEVLRPAEEAGFEVRDVESLREHYALTLRHWVRHLEARHEEALHHVDEPTHRIWRLYMAGAAHAFAVGRLNVHQTLLVKPDDGRSGVPLTRADWYAA